MGDRELVRDVMGWCGVSSGALREALEACDCDRAHCEHILRVEEVLGACAMDAEYWAAEAVAGVLYRDWYWSTLSGGNVTGSLREAVLLRLKAAARPDLADLGDEALRRVAAPLLGEYDRPLAAPSEAAIAACAAEVAGALDRLPHVDPALASALCDCRCAARPEGNDEAPYPEAWWCSHRWAVARRLAELVPISSAGDDLYEDEFAFQSGRPPEVGTAVARALLAYATLAALRGDRRRCAYFVNQAAALPRAPYLY